ncbi:glycosyltransferase [Paraburkholderia sp. SIMBA_049]
MANLIEVRELIAARRLPEAEAACNAVLEKEASAECYHLLGYVAQQTSRYALSAELCARAADLGLKDWSNYLILGLSQMALGEHESACRSFEAAHCLSPLNLDAAIYFLEETYATEGFEAAQAVRQSFSPELLGKRVDQAWRQIAVEHETEAIRTMMNLGRCEEAEVACRELLRKRPSKLAYCLLSHLESHNQWRRYSAAQRERNGRSRATISVLLITYNHEKYIAQAIESILMQETEYDVEIIVVEDCSTDNTRDVIMRYASKYPNKIKTFFNPRNIGLLDPPQQKVTYAGFKKLSGDYMAILEGDDYWSSRDKLQKQISFLEKNPEFIACAHNTIKKYEDGSQPEHRFLYWENTKTTHTVDDFITYSFFHTSSMVYRNLFQGEPSKFFREKWSCDIFLNIYHAHHGKVKYLNEDMSVYRAHTGGLYSTLSELQGCLFNINGLQHYNRWLGYRYLKSFSFQIARRCQLMLGNHSIGVTGFLRLKYTIVEKFYRTIFELISIFPRLDPAVFWYGEPLE